MIALTHPEAGSLVQAPVVEGLTRTQIVQYAGASGDFNPIHTDEPYATDAGYPSVFGHGMLTMGLTARLLTGAFGYESLRSFGGRFLAQVWPGDTLVATATVTAVDARSDGTVVDIDVVTENAVGTAVFRGDARVHLPPSCERA